MKIIVFIEQEEIIKKILKHLGLWLVKKRSPPKIHAPPIKDYFGSTVFDPEEQTRRELAEVSDSQIPPWDDDYSDPDYPFEAYL